MTELIAAHGEEEFADSWLRAKGLDWAADLIVPDELQHTTEQTKETLMKPPIEMVGAAALAVVLAAAAGDG